MMKLTPDDVIISEKSVVDLFHDGIRAEAREFAYSLEQLQLYTHKNKVDGKTYLRYEEHRNPKDETIGSLKDRMDDYQSEIEQDDQIKIYFFNRSIH